MAVVIGVVVVIEALAELEAEYLASSHLEVTVGAWTEDN